MSWYNTIVLSFSSNEFEGEDEQVRGCEPLRKIDAWLKRHKFEILVDLAEGPLGSNAVLFGGCYNYLDVDKLCKFIGKLKWNSVEDVRLLSWGDNDDTFTLIAFPLK